MASDLEKLLQEHFDDPYHRGGCDCATHAAQDVVSGTSCELGIELALDEEGQVLEAWFDGAGCETCEGLSSLMMENLEGLSLETLKQWTEAQFLEALNVDLNELQSPCRHLPWSTLQKALRGALVELDEDLTDGTQFGGPSLREEC